MRYDVTSCSLDLTSLIAPKINRPKPGPRVVWSTRTEMIDTKKNVLFSDCKGEWEIADRYEAFWNRLNDDDEKFDGNCHNQTARVVVINVRIVE